MPEATTSSISLDELKKQLAHTEVELEHAKSHVYRCDGVIQILKHLIASAETPDPGDDAPIDAGDEKES